MTGIAECYIPTTTANIARSSGCAVVSGGNIVLQTGYIVERVMVFPAALSGAQITAIREVM